MKRVVLKGVYRLNPTQMVFKQASVAARRGVTENVPGYQKKPAKTSVWVKVNRGTKGK